jgi:hypothetical protein
MGLHPMVEKVVKAYLNAVDSEAPGIIEGLYLIGSTALDEFRPNTSDIDFVAITAARCDAAMLAGLARTHSRLRRFCRRPTFDGLYVTWDDLASHPAHAEGLPYSHEGCFHASGSRGDPVTWETVARRGIPYRGPKPEALKIWTDAEFLATWTLNNLDVYWRRLLLRAVRFPDPWSLTAFTTYGAVWIVLGISRLHYTLATGEICSKEAAGRYAIETFPEQWHRVLNESLRIRRADRARPHLASAVTEIAADLRIFARGQNRSLYRTFLARRRDVLAFGDMIIADASCRYDNAQEHVHCGQVCNGADGHV